MAYTPSKFDLDKDGFLKGAPAVDMLGGAQSIEKGREIIAQGREGLQEELERLGNSLPALPGMQETAATKSSDAAIEKKEKPSFIEILFSRGIYLIVGTIFLIMGLVMLSRPVREGVVEGVRDAIAE